MERPAYNVAEAKRRLSEILGRVAFGGESIIITRRGKPMAMLVPVDQKARGLGDVEGWLDDDDCFFAEIDSIVGARGLDDVRLPELGRSI